MAHQVLHKRRPPTLLSAATGQGDTSLQVIPAVSQPGAGQTYVDPAFGTQILRLTDATIADSAHIPYAYWPIWNTTSTRLWIERWTVGGIASAPVKTLWDWDNTTGVASNMRALQTGGVDLSLEGLIWSRSSASLLYGFSSGDLKLYSLVPEGSSSVVVDLTARVQAVLATGHHFWQMSMGGTDRYFAWTVKNSSDADLGVAVYDLTLDTLYVRDLSGVTLFDEAHLTRDGALVLISSNPGPALLWDYVAHPTSPWTTTSFGQVIAHEDFGPSTQMFAANAPEVSGAYAVWDLASFNAGTKTADQASTLVANVKAASATVDWPEIHASWQNLTSATPQFAYADLEVGTDQTAAWCPYFDELWQMNTTSFTYRRLAHHRSEVWGTTNAYRSQPKGCVDPSGRWYAYTSNWQKAATVSGETRVDIYILKIPTEAEFAAGRYLS